MMSRVVGLSFRMRLLLGAAEGAIVAEVAMAMVGVAVGCCARRVVVAAGVAEDEMVVTMEVAGVDWGWEEVGVAVLVALVASEARCKGYLSTRRRDCTCSLHGRSSCGTMSAHVPHMRPRVDGRSGR